MIFSGLSQLVLYPVVNRGIPNAERIPIYVQEPTNIGQFGVMAGPSEQDGFAKPFKDNLYWFSDGWVKSGDWIFLYTGSGAPKTEDIIGSKESKIYTVHWGKTQTMFANSTIVPIVFRIDAVQVGQKPGDLPQLF
ncbi:hypothetical protein E0L35_15445 [Halomonas sp. ATBC28]|uniref:hypothetical protein n=1 Tax=Halomonas sp. ATBC28 TaxID=2545264 RepID=UPI00110F1E72|nr:hypothetical protein [Halomonas sp. ATBC28]TMU22858.1 hypothetical protein E0L35_15445 [Halomonas sp. ATBC28]